MGCGSNPTALVSLNPSEPNLIELSNKDIDSSFGAATTISLSNNASTVDRSGASIKVKEIIKILIYNVILPLVNNRIQNKKNLQTLKLMFIGFLELMERIELSTCGLRYRCSTIEPH